MPGPAAIRRCNRWRFLGTEQREGPQVPFADAPLRRLGTTINDPIDETINERRHMLRSLTILLAMAAGGTGGPHNPCPHQVIDPKPARVESHHLQTCGTNINVNMFGVSMSTPLNTCPLFVILFPNYDSTKPEPNSNTYTMPVRTVTGVRKDYACVQHWLLFIPLGTSCEEQASVPWGMATHYEQRPCGVAVTSDE